MCIAGFREPFRSGLAPNEGGDGMQGQAAQVSWLKQLLPQQRPFVMALVAHLSVSLVQWDQ